MATGFPSLPGWKSHHCWLKGRAVSGVFMSSGGRSLVTQQGAGPHLQLPTPVVTGSPQGPGVTILSDLLWGLRFHGSIWNLGWAPSPEMFVVFLPVRAKFGGSWDPAVQWSVWGISSGSGNAQEMKSCYMWNQDAQLYLWCHLNH